MTIELLRRAGIQKNSKSWYDYERAKSLLVLEDYGDYEKTMVKIAKYLGL